MSESYLPYFTLEKKDYIATITLSRPDKRNAIATPFFETLYRLENELVNDKSIRVVVILADGKHFSAGTDFDDIKKDRKAMEFGNGRANYCIQRWQQAFRFLEEFDIPVIAGIQGACFGSGVEFVSAAHIRVAADNSSYFMGEVKGGMCSDLGGTTRLTRLIGRSQALRLLLTAERIDAQEALRIGLVDKVVPVDQLKETVMQMAKAITTMSPFAVMTTMRVSAIAEEGSPAAGLTAERISSSYVTQTNDRLAAIRSMVDEFQGGTYAPEFTLD